MSDRPTVAVVTGASRGLGAGLAEAFASRGMALGLCARTQPPVPKPATAVSRSVDVTDADALEAFTDEVVSTLGPIDLWVNNAGVLGPIGPLAEADPAALVRHLQVNVDGVVHGSRLYARHVRSRPGGGMLVNISSGAGSTPYQGWAVYGASKAAVDMLTEVVAAEEAKHGLLAYAVAPGRVNTDMQALIRSTSPEDFPAVDRYHRALVDGDFNPPWWVADYILGLRDDPSRANGAIRLRVPDRPPGCV